MSTVCEPLVKIRRKCCPYEQCPYERDILQLVLYVYQAETVWILVATKSLVDKFFVQAPRTMFNVNDENSRTLSSLCIRPSLAHPTYNKHQSVILYLIFGLKQCMSCKKLWITFHVAASIILHNYGTNPYENSNSEIIYLSWLHHIY